VTVKTMFQELQSFKKILFQINAVSMNPQKWIKTFPQKNK